MVPDFRGQACISKFKKSPWCQQGLTLWMLEEYTWLTFTLAGLVPSRADSHIHISQSSFHSFWCPFRHNMQFWFFCVTFQLEVPEMMWNSPAACEKGAFLAPEWGTHTVLCVLGCGNVWGHSHLGQFRGARSVKRSEMWSWEQCLVPAVPAAVGSHCFKEGLWNRGRQGGGMGAAAGAWACSQNAAVRMSLTSDGSQAPLCCQGHLGCARAQGPAFSCQSYTGSFSAE